MNSRRAACASPRFALGRCRPNSRRAPAFGESSYPRFFTQSAERVAEEGYRGLHAGRRLVVPGFGNKLITVHAAFRATRAGARRGRHAPTQRR